MNLNDQLPVRPMTDHTRPLIHRLVMVDDRPLMLRGFKDVVRELHNDAWSVVVHASANDLLLDLERQFLDLPTLVSIDLGLLPDPLSATYGLDLLESVHAEYPGLKLVVHSGILPISDVAAQVILAVPASYISTADDAGVRAYAALLPWLAQGFRVYSPVVSNAMGRIAITHPDPLDDTDWAVLDLLSQNKGNTQIADAMQCSDGAISDRISRIAARLNSLGHIKVEINSKSVPHRYREPLKKFFEDNAHKYGRRRRAPNSST